MFVFFICFPLASRHTFFFVIFLAWNAGESKAKQEPVDFFVDFGQGCVEFELWIDLNFELGGLNVEMGVFERWAWHCAPEMAPAALLEMIGK